MTSTPGVSRRHFHTGAIYGMMAAISAALGLPALVYLFAPVKARKSEEWIDIGDASRLETGVPVEMTFRRNRLDGWKLVSEKGTAWVVKQAAGPIVAFGPQCTHLGCAYHYEEERKQFLCPCHTSLFALDGKVAAGPAPRPLDRFEIKVEAGKLLLGRLRTGTEAAG